MLSLTSYALIIGLQVGDTYEPVVNQHVFESEMGCYASRTTAAQEFLQIMQDMGIDMTQFPNGVPLMVGCYPRFFGIMTDDMARLLLNE